MTEVFRVQETNAQHIKDLHTRVTAVSTAFPNGDLAGHAAYHESVIRWYELRNRILQEALSKVVQAGSVAALGYLAMLLWKWFKLEVTR